MSFSLPTNVELLELAGRVRSIADDLVSSSGCYSQRRQQRILDILAPPDSDGGPTNPWQELYTRLVRTESPSKAGDDLRDALRATLTVLGDLYRHQGPQHVPRLDRAADKLERIAANRSTEVIATAVALSKFKVDRTTLQRAVRDGRLESHRLSNAPKNGRHMYSESELAKLFPRR